ncbi:MAG: winged helix-turn-helix transcriptional regulator [Acidobacteria bacterium]|nr:winged helix-turn-helix transcriptional regulator [Acidobacteriota bacterium]
MSKSKNILKNGRISLDVEDCQAFVGRRRIHLTSTEYNLLAAFLKNRGKTVSRDELLSSVWGDTYRGTSRTVDTHIQRLRSKLGTAGRLIRTVRSVGYRLDTNS